MSLGTKLSAVVFGQHIHPILILVIFSSAVVWNTKFTTVTRKCNACDFFIWGCLKYKVYSSNPWIEEEPKRKYSYDNCKYSCRTASKGKSEPLLPVWRMFTAFHHFLWSVNCNDFIPNVIGQQAYWFIGKIHMRLAASSALVTIKCRSMNQSTKVRTSLYMMSY
jgi:hypothetical protein